MNEPLPNCEPWHEAISLLAAGCLPADEETGVRQHLAGCAACAAPFAELTAVCVTLSRSRPAAMVHAAAIRSRWSEAADRVTTRRPVPSVPWRVFWLSGALAVSLLIVVLDGAVHRHTWAARDTLSRRRRDAMMIATVAETTSRFRRDGVGSRFRANRLPSC
jgi:anti-sigma factor RsiW